MVITTEDTLLSAALSKNSALRDDITQQFLSAGIKQEKIKSSKFSTSPQYGWFGKKPNSYKVINRMSISISDENHLKEVALVADNRPEAELSDTAFEHTKKDEFKDQIKQAALTNVMKQKKSYEQVLGIKLVPIGFRQDHVHQRDQRATRGAMLLEEIVVTASKRSRSNENSPKSVSSYDSGITLSFDEVNYQAGIYVDFKIDIDAK